LFEREQPSPHSCDGRGAVGRPCYNDGCLLFVKVSKECHDVVALIKRGQKNGVKGKVRVSHPSLAGEMVNESAKADQETQRNTKRKIDGGSISDL